MKTRLALSGVTLVASALLLAACGGGMQSLPTNTPSGASTTSAGITRTAYVVRLTPQHRVIVVNATAVSAHGSDVSIRYASGSTEILHGQTPTVTQSSVVYRETPAGAHVLTCRFPGPGCGCPTGYVLSHYDQATDYREVNNGSGLDYYYDLFWVAPAYDDYVSGTETDSWSGTYADGTTFSYTYPPETWYPGYSASVSSSMDFDGGPSQDYIGQNQLSLSYTDIYGNTWDAYGTKGHVRCTT